MTSVFTKGLTGRLAAWLFVFGPIGAITAVFLPLPTGTNKPDIVLLCSASFLLGLVYLRIPWEAWPQSMTLWLIVPPAYGLLSAAGFIMLDVLTYLYGTFWVLSATWVGVGQKRWTPLRIAPFTALMMGLPFYFRAEIPAATVLYNTLIITSICVLVGELLAWVSEHIEQAEDRDLRHIDGQRALLEASTTLAYQVDADTAGYVVARTIGELLDSETGLVFILGDPGPTVMGSWPEPIDDLHITNAQCEPVMDAIREGRALVIHSDDPCPILEILEVQTLFVIPVRGADTPIGAIAVGYTSPDHKLDEFTWDLAHTFATQAGLAFERVWATQVLLDESLLDELTGVGNRRHASALLSNLHPGDTVAMLDLDHFKEINDTYGHVLGDEVLQDLGAYLRKALRDNDSVARYGGEEFLVVLRRAGEAGAGKLDELLKGWCRQDPRTTFSVGVAVHKPGLSAATTLKRADEALYAAKSQGRNRVCADASARGGNRTLTPHRG